MHLQESAAVERSLRHGDAARAGPPHGTKTEFPDVFVLLHISAVHYKLLHLPAVFPVFPGIPCASVLRFFPNRSP